ncbi:MAG: hypothetical protein HC796_10240 [Synechococcaceae cyanobacterium RL_1_2]|nr:hypothetical protein [Synechococcaceae cyanobacterium RL_1_2]
MMRNPFPFLSTMYPKVLHDRVESYYHGHLINPDKPFAWELLRLADRAYFIDYPLFAYREHNQNQGSQQAKMGALKHQVDEYTATLNVSEQMLKQVNLDREDLIQAFIEQDIALRGLKMLSEGNSLLAKRTLLFGRATYPQFINRNFKIWGLRILLSLGFIGELIAKASYRTAVNKWQQKQH